MLRRIDIDGARVIDVAAELGITPNRDQRAVVLGVRL